MQNPKLASLPGALGSSSIRSISDHLGASEQKVLDGVQSFIAAVTTSLWQRSAAQNRKLSQDRADSVVDRLVAMNISRDRLVAKGYGDEHPVADNSTAEGRALNRRISMLVTAK